jgi:hypothetical protein
MHVRPMDSAAVAPPGPISGVLSNRFGRALLAAIILAGAGALCAFLITRVFGEPGFQGVPAAAGAAAFVAGLLVWYWLGGRPTSTWRGFSVGGLASIVAHPILYLIVFMIAFIDEARQHGVSFPSNPLELLAKVLIGSVVMAVVTMVVSIVTFPLGGAAGMLVSWFFRYEEA